MSNQSTSAPIHPQQSTVEYRDIAGFPGYRIGNDGTVLSCWNFANGMTDQWKMLNPALTDKGYRQVQLTLGDGKRAAKYVARLVLEAFIGPCPEGMECCHEDGNQLNNRVGNLRWDTHHANMMDRTTHGRTARGSRVGAAKLTEDQVIAIRQLAKDGATRKELGERFGVDPSQISRAISGVFWAHVEGADATDKRVGATHMCKARTCTCGRTIVGPSFFNHVKFCSLAK